MRHIFVLFLASSALAADLPSDHARRMESGLKSFQQEVAGLLKENCLQLPRWRER
jgi:hypothetical protein